MQKLSNLEEMFCKVMDIEFKKQIKSLMVIIIDSLNCWSIKINQLCQAVIKISENIFFLKLKRIL